MFNAPTFDPTFYTALHSLDLGSVQSPDGREHYLDALTPVSLVASPIPDVVGASSVAPPSGDVTTASNPLTGTLNYLASKALPAHFGARVAVGVLAIGLLLVVAFRLTK